MADTSFGETLTRLRYKWSFQQFVAELLQKRWMEPVVPFTAAVLVILAFAFLIPGYLTVGNIVSTGRQFGEFGFVAIAIAVVIISGGIDLSVGSIFAMANFIALMLFNMYEVSAPLSIVITLMAGALMGAVNGILIGYFGLGAFLTTLVTMLIFRAILNLLILRYSVEMAISMGDSRIWDWLGGGSVLGIPANILILALVAVVGHIFLSRGRPGWYIAAIGANRKAARHAGIPVERHLFLTYVISGVLTALGGVFYAARLNSPSSDTGVGMEVLALTAVVLGGVNLSGGRGSIGQSLIGATIVLVLINGLVRFGLVGGATSAFLGFMMLLAVGIDVKWARNRNKAIEKIYVVPTYFKLGARHDISPDGSSAYALNNRLRDAEKARVSYRALAAPLGTNDDSIAVLDGFFAVHAGDKRAALAAAKRVKLAENSDVEDLYLTQMAFDAGGDAASAKAVRERIAALHEVSIADAVVRMWLERDAATPERRSPRHPAAPLP